MLEYMMVSQSFRSTRKYTRGALIRFFESVGANFGADLNAHTALEETVYKLQIPYTSDSVLDKSIEVNLRLRSLTHNLLSVRHSLSTITTLTTLY